MHKIATLLGLLALSLGVQAADEKPGKMAEKTREALAQSGGLSGAPQIPSEQGAQTDSGGAISNPLSDTKIAAPKVFMKPTLSTVEGEAAKQKISDAEGAKKLNAALAIEAERFNRLFHDKFSVSLLDTGDGLVRQFVATGILKMNPDIYTRMESGLAAIYLSNGKINGQARPVCYVLNNPSRAEHLWRGFVSHESRKESDIQWGASYLMAHEVGHCLDRQQREDITQRGEWDSTQMEAMGIPVAAFNRTFGEGRKINANEYRQQQIVLYRDGALLQYQERVADAFAVLWMMGNKSPNENLKPIWDTRIRVGGHGKHKSHSTLPTLQKAYALGMDMKELPSMEHLWTLARRAQMEGGIDASLGANSTMVHAEAENREAAPDTKPGQVAKNGTLPAVVRFDRLKKFGQ